MADQQDIKKRAERAWLDRFLNLYDEHVGGKIIPAESPDFILAGSRKTNTGIELTSIIVNQAHGRYLTKEAIDECIARKNGKLKLYRKRRMDQYWLIIILEGPGDVMIHQNTGSWQFESEFHRIFLFDPSREMISRIK